MKTQIVDELFMNSSMNEIQVPDGTGWKTADRAWSVGHYIVAQERPGEPFEYLDGPFADPGFARHRQRVLYDPDAGRHEDSNSEQESLL